MRWISGLQVLDPGFLVNGIRVSIVSGFPDFKWGDNGAIRSFLSLFSFCKRQKINVTWRGLR